MKVRAECASCDLVKDMKLWKLKTSCFISGRINASSFRIRGNLNILSKRILCFNMPTMCIKHRVGAVKSSVILRLLADLGKWPQQASHSEKSWQQWKLSSTDRIFQTSQLWASTAAGCSDKHITICLIMAEDTVNKVWQWKDIASQVICVYCVGQED